MKKLIDVYDFFSGCGGASKGFSQAGLSIRLGIDIDEDASVTFQRNFPNAGFVCDDIRNVKPSDIVKYVTPERPKLFCGCAPCQPFSKQNLKKRSDDIRKDLLGEFSRFVRHFLPEYVFIENVPGIQKIKTDKGPFSKFVRNLSELGYSYNYDVISAADYGVPQHRMRLILIAARQRQISFPSKTNGPSTNQDYSVVGDWIRDLPPIMAGEVDINDPDHVASKLSPVNIMRIMTTPEGGGRESWPEALRLDCHREHIGHTDVYGRLSFAKVACTLTTRCISYSNGRYGHPNQNRALSIREAACLQTFPREYRFFGNMNSRAKQIGNAVPPLLAYHFGKNFEKLNT